MTLALFFRPRYLGLLRRAGKYGIFYENLLYIDESGNHTHKDIEEPARRYLGLTGCFVEGEVYRTQFYPAFEALKQAHFPHSPDEPVILHRNDLINRRGPFWRLRDPENERRFNEDLLQFLTDQDYLLITVVIDKKTHIERYGDAAYHPYHYYLAALLERYCGFLNRFNAQGDVVAESRGGTEDRQLGAAYRRRPVRPGRRSRRQHPAPPCARPHGLEGADNL